MTPDGGVYPPSMAPFGGNRCRMPCQRPGSSPWWACELDDSDTSPRSPRAWPICRELCRPARRSVELDVFLAHASRCEVVS